MTNDCISEPRADRGPHAGSPRGVVVATGRKLEVCDRRLYARVLKR